MFLKQERPEMDDLEEIKFGCGGKYYKICLTQCSGSRSTRIHLIWPDLDPLQETWIQIRVEIIAINSHKQQPKL